PQQAFGETPGFRSVWPRADSTDNRLQSKSPGVFVRAKPCRTANDGRRDLQGPSRATMRCGHGQRVGDFAHQKRYSANVPTTGRQNHVSKSKAFLSA